MTINIQAKGVEMTEALRAHAQKKMEMVEKFFDNIQKIEINLGMKDGNHNKGKIFYAEANVHIPGKIIRVSKDTGDLYKAVDKVKDHLKVEFEKIKGKMRNLDKEVLREQKGYQE